jgi:hypothetical protein
MKKNHVSSATRIQKDRSATGTRRKLTLDRETLRHLGADEIRLAAGGAAETPASGDVFCHGDDI